MLLFQSRTFITNLVISAILLSSCSFNYFMINFDLKYLPGDIFVNTIVATVFEIIFYSISYSLFHTLGLKKSFVLGFVISLIGSLPLIFVGKNYERLVPAMILLARGGISYNVNISYLSFSILFPPMYS